MPTNLLLKKTDKLQTAQPLPPKEALPTMYDLPSENPDDPGLADEFHYYQLELLRETFCPPDYPPERFYVASDLYIYYDVHHPKWYKRPDWFAAVDVPRLYNQREMRMSYVIWQEEVVPSIVVELLDESTEKDILGQTRREINQPPTKWQVYEQMLQIPYYIIFARDPDQFRPFHLTNGRYRELTPPDKRVWLPEIKLGLGLWEDVYHGVERKWLRWYDADGKWIPTPVEKEQQRAEQLRAEQEKARAEQEKARAEQKKARAEQKKARAEQEKMRAEQEKARAKQEKMRAEQEKARAEQEKMRAEQEKARAEQLAAQLRALGIEPNI
jgi:Uma2 family endonuclease